VRARRSARAAKRRSANCAAASADRSDCLAHTKISPVTTRGDKAQTAKEIAQFMYDVIVVRHAHN
jgi:hypothetical protein